MNTQETKLDDLTIIKGIGPTRQEWLRNSFHVRTYDDLAALSLDEIEAQFKAERQIASRSEIASWIAQAQELATAVALQAVTATAPTATTTDAARKSKVNGSMAPVDWKAAARFVIEYQSFVDETIGARKKLYQTVVNHLDLDTDHLLHSQSWAGIESERLCTWMLEQVGERGQPLTKEESPVATKPAPALNMKITQVRLFQPPQAQTPSAIGEADVALQGIIASGEPFALEAAFELTGTAVANIVNKQALYRAQYYLFNLTTGVSTHLGDSSPTALSTDKLSYTAKLFYPTLLPGIYRLRVILLLENRPPVADYLEIPLLQVV